ncbi:MAG: phosphatase PAP2 family protein [Acidobacteriia bacterium]|nr:phosphatase PAP2 family protein [Terriglobia bacterium]
MATPQSAPRLWPIDKLFISYAALAVCLLAFTTLHDLFALLLILGHVAAIGLLLLLARSTSPIVIFLRHWFLAVYVPFCYKQVPYFVSALKLRAVDVTLAHWDLAMWKVDPVFWLSSMPNRFLVEFLQVVYTMFIPGTLLLGIVLWVRRPRQEFRYGTFVIAATFLISYLGYILMPARGPRFMDYASLHPPLKGLWMFQTFQGALDGLEGAQYDCFPSGHVAVVLVGCYVARRISSPVFYVFSAFAVLITFSTIYLRYHYVIDVIAGMVLAIAVIVAAPSIYRRLDSGNPLA